jgi:hypothetical protein
MGFPDCDPQAKPDAVSRFWSFTRIKTDGEEPIGAERFQVGGSVNETVNFGDLVLFPPLAGPSAKGEVFSNEGGATYWVSAQAPSAVLGPGVTIGNRTELTQYQHFKKTDAKATLTVVVTKAFMEAIDENGGAPTALECPWHQPGGNFFNCRHVMWSWVDFHLEAFSFATNTTFLQTSGFAELAGFGGDFRYDAYTKTGSTRRFWGSNDFGFEPDVEGDGGGHAVAYLAAPITIEIPLSTIQVGDTFSVMAALKPWPRTIANEVVSVGVPPGPARRERPAMGVLRSRAGGTPATKPTPSIPSPRPRVRVARTFRPACSLSSRPPSPRPELAGDGDGGDHPLRWSKGAVSALLTPPMARHWRGRTTCR